MKKIITLFVLLFANIYCIGQSVFLETETGVISFNTGTAFRIKMNPTNPPQGCTTQEIVLNIGILEYVPTSNVLPAGTSVVPSVNGANNILTISNFSNTGGGASQTLLVGVRFAPGTCNTVTTTIDAELKSCNVVQTEAIAINLTSKTGNNAAASITKMTPYPASAPNDKFCLGQQVKYLVGATNSGSNVTSINNGSQLILYVPKCAIVVGVYDNNTHALVSSTTTTEATTQKVVWSNPVIPASGAKYYEVYIQYPCDDGTDNCISGVYNLNVHLEGTTACGVTINTNPFPTTTNVNRECTIAMCTGGDLSSVQIGENLPCPTFCNNSPYVYFTVDTPPNNPSLANRIFTVTIPTVGLINITSASISGGLCSGSTVKYYNTAGTEIPVGSLPSSAVKKIVYTLPCSTVAQSTYFYVFFNYATPFTATNLQFDYQLQAQAGGEAVVSGSYTGNISTCNQTIYKYKYVRKLGENSSGSSNAVGLPGDSFTYRLYVQNTQGVNPNTVIQDVLNSNLEYMGGLKYAYTNNFSFPTFTNLTDIDNSFVLPGTSTTVSVSTPSIGTNGTIKFDNFDMPCSANYLCFEFNVRVRNNVIAPTSIPNVFTVDNQNSGFASISILALTKVTSRMFVKCPTSGDWSDSTINVKNGEDINLKMRVANEGSTSVLLSQLINLKPQPNDQYEIGTPQGNVPRNNASASTINYSCETPAIISNLATQPSVTYEYAQNGINMDRSMICPPTGSGNPPVWNAESSCGLTSNWLKVQFPAGFALNPGEFIEVIYKGKVSGGLGTTRNSFAFRVVNASGQCSIASDDAELTIVNDGVGCVPLSPCADLLDSVDGTFGACNSVAGTNDFNGNVNCGGWSNLSNSPDTWKMPIATSLNPFINTQIPSSQNGGAFAGAIGKVFGNDKIESFKTEIHNLIPGQSYRVDFEQINMTNLSFLNNSVNWKVTFGDQVRYSPELTTVANPQWSNVSINFIATATDQTLTFEGYSTIVTNPNVAYTSFSYIGIDNITVKNNVACPAPVACTDCTSFDLIKEHKYLVSGWVKEAYAETPDTQFKNYDKSSISISFTDVNGNLIDTEQKFYPAGEVIDGWQRIVGEFIVPLNVDDMHLELLNESTDSKMSYFDDIRVLPSKGNLKSFVYDQQTQRLMAELDENNYSTFYEYDLEGGLIRIKKETEKGVFTIQETRSGNTKSGN
ncbi:hypothetical protein [Flavobacterium sp.]|uniref:hypothetical protein n=1 Tax=Flavobacterium sp. TaxID=239 RepID=UPI003D6B65E3